MKTSYVSIIHAHSGLGWLQEHALLMCDTASSMDGFFSKRVCTLWFYFYLFCLVELWISSIASFSVHHPISRVSSLLLFSFRNITFQILSMGPILTLTFISVSQCSYLQGLFLSIFTLTMKCLFLKVIYLSPFYPFLCSFFRTSTSSPSKGLW